MNPSNIKEIRHHLLSALTLLSEPVETTDIPVISLNLSPRTQNVLRTLNIRFIGDLCSLTKVELMRTENCGIKTVYELEHILALHGLSFKTFDPYSDKGA